MVFPFRVVYTVYCIITFVALFLILFPFFLLLSLFGEKGRKGNWLLIRIWSYVWFFLIVIPVRIIHDNNFDKKKKYIIVANHTSYLDTAMIFRSIPFYAKPLAKAELAKIPLFGFLYKQLAVTVDRGNDKSKRRSVHLLKRHLKREGSIFIFPEGTFNESDEPLKEFYDGAFRIAMETETSILPVIFPDTKKRMHYSSIFSLNPGICRAIFLPAIPASEFPHHTIKSLKELIKSAMVEALLAVE